MAYWSQCLDHFTGHNVGTNSALPCKTRPIITHVRNFQRKTHSHTYPFVVEIPPWSTAISGSRNAQSCRTEKANAPFKDPIQTNHRRCQACRVPSKYASGLF